VVVVGMGRGRGRGGAVFRFVDLSETKCQNKIGRHNPLPPRQPQTTDILMRSPTRARTHPNTHTTATDF